ncbi:MAG: hypothetical protein U0136_13860 [Bdellovibrionota bacterium]
MPIEREETSDVVRIEAIYLVRGNVDGPATFLLRLQGVNAGSGLVLSISEAESVRCVTDLVVAMSNAGWRFTNSFQIPDDDDVESKWEEISGTVVPVTVLEVRAAKLRRRSENGIAITLRPTKHIEGMDGRFEVLFRPAELAPSLAQWIGALVDLDYPLDELVGTVDPADISQWGQHWTPDDAP